MDFDFNSDQYMLRDSVRSFLQDRWGPKKLRAAAQTFDAELWNGLCGLGLQTLLVPESEGGSGLQVVDLVMVLEEFGRALVPAAMTQTVLASEVIARFGTQRQRSDWLPAIVDGKACFAFAHSEEGCGHTAPEVGLRAEPSGAGWRLTGRKILVPCAGAATHFVVSAVHAGRPGLFVCKADAAGVQVAGHQAVDSFSLLASVSFDNTQAFAIGDTVRADALERLVETHTFAAAAQMVGVAAAALDIAVAFAKDRVQFGKPIGSFQAIKHKCADMLVALECARSAAYFAAWALTEDDAPQQIAVSMAKAACSDAARHICNESLQIHGGVGFTWEFDIHLYLRRSKLLEYTWGDASFHRERVAVQVLDSKSTPESGVDVPQLAEALA